MKRDYLFSIINLILFIICNILINYVTGGVNILITVFFYMTWSFSLIGVYFILHEYVKTLNNNTIIFSKKENGDYYFSYPMCIILFLIGIVFFLAWYYVNRFGAIQYEMFSIINGVILVSQIVIKVLIDLKIIRVRFN